MYIITNIIEHIITKHNIDKNIANSVVYNNFIILIRCKRIRTSIISAEIVLPIKLHTYGFTPSKLVCQGLFGQLLGPA